jgi:hypothetical protein
VPRGYQERNSLLIYSQDATTSAKPLVTTSIVYFLNPHLPQSRSAHDARLDCYVERSFREWILPNFRREFFISDNTVDCLEFCVACSLGWCLSYEEMSTDWSLHCGVHLCGSSLLRLLFHLWRIHSLQELRLLRAPPLPDVTIWRFFEFVSMDESVLGPHHSHGLLHPFQMFAAVHLKFMKFMDMGVVSF